MIPMMYMLLEEKGEKYPKRTKLTPVGTAL
jgi:hypothetical protein